jgi:hypothetical protein
MDFEDYWEDSGREEKLAIAAERLNLPSGVVKMIKLYCESAFNAGEIAGMRAAQHLVEEGGGK